MNHQRFAGDKAKQLGVASLLAASGGLLAHGLAHDDMDFLVHDFKVLNQRFQNMSPEAQSVYVEITGRPGMSGLDRAFVNMALDGELDPEKYTAPAKTEGDVAVQMAMALRAKAPSVAEEVRQLNEIELDLIAKEIDKGTNPQEVMEASAVGAGVSPIPAFLGGVTGSTIGMNVMRPGRRV
jgi:hypothetical protein